MIKNATGRRGTVRRAFPVLHMLTVLVLAAPLLAACAQTEDNPTILDQPRGAPTVPPPQWVQPADAITLNTVSAIRLLGRLDNPLMPSTVFDHALSPDGTRLAGLDDQVLVVWDLITGATVFSVQRFPEATRVFFSYDKTEVYTVELNGQVTAYNAENGANKNNFQGINAYTGVVAHNDEGGWLAFGSTSGEVRVWDPLKRQALATLDAHGRSVTRVAFSASGDRLATADDTGEVKVWDWSLRAPLTTINDALPALALSFSPDGTLLAVGTRQDIRLWSLPDGALRRTLPAGEGAVEIVKFSPDGRYLFSGGEIPDMQVWDVQSGALAARLPGVGQDRLSLAFSPDGALALTSELGGTVTLWNLTTMTENTVNRADLDVQGLFVYGVDWTQDGLLALLFGATGSVYVWGIPPAS
jgi:WD40 repeat protein